MRWPDKFRLVLAEKYDSSTNSEEFLQIYTTMVQATGGHGKVMANYFPTALTNSARPGLMNLPSGRFTPRRTCATSSSPTSREPTPDQDSRTTYIRSDSDKMSRYETTSGASLSTETPFRGSRENP